MVWGWSLDPDNANTSNAIHFYIDGPAGTGTFIGAVVANSPRPDVNSVTGYPGDHGFGFQIPTQYLNGQNHSIYAYGIDTGADAPTLLNGSPKTFTILSPNAFTYDLAGNMTRGQNADGVWQRYEYDDAGRLKRVTDDAGNWLSDDAYGSGRQRVFRNSGGLTWYVWGGDSVLAEYTSTSWGGAYTWAKSYIYAGSRLLFTTTNNGAGGEVKEFHHPDRLGTRMVTDPAADTLYLQSTLPFGTQFDSETTGSSNRLFTSYDRSAGTGLDNAVNRTYSSGQGRFTQVDPIQMSAASIGNPQSNNLYSYVQNSPTDFVDPSGLLLGIGCYFVGSFTYGDFRYDVWVCVEESTGGGGHTGSPSEPSPGPGTGHEVPREAAQKPDKPKCNQSNTPEEHAAVAGQLNSVAPAGSIGRIRSEIDSNGDPTEGILFDVYDVPAFKQALRDAGLKDSLINFNHLKAVNGSFFKFNSSEFRSDTDGTGNIGPDSNSNGIVRSLQATIGPVTKPPGANSTDPGVATGRADLDCDSPNQDVVSIGKHAGPIIGRKFASFGRAIGRGIKSFFGF